MTPAALQDQERLLSEALAAGASGQQRRVQSALLRETRRELQAVEAGWEPFEPSPEWAWGYVEDPRFLHGRVRVASALLALPLALLGGALLSLRWEVLQAALAGTVLLLGLQAVLHSLLGRVAEDRDSRRLAGGDELRMFNAPMPARAVEAYRRARESGLFDTFVVYSPRP
ncbi:MAG TPA: hypothetical protein VF157_06460, partial [Chloroflexota bacterium]